MMSYGPVLKCNNQGIIAIHFRPSTISCYLEFADSIFLTTFASLTGAMRMERRDLSNGVNISHSHSIRDLSSVGSEHLPYKQGVAGSNPAGPTGKSTGYELIFVTCFCWCTPNAPRRASFVSNRLLSRY